MEQFGPTTAVFESFNQDLESSFLLASLLGDAFVTASSELKSSLDLIIQRSAGIDALTLSRMTGQDASIWVTDGDNDRIVDLE